MILFGYVFILYFTKLSVGNGFWYNLRNTYNNHIQSSAEVPTMFKYGKCDLDIQFHHNYKSNVVYSEFIRWKIYHQERRDTRERYTQFN